MNDPHTRPSKFAFYHSTCIHKDGKNRMRNILKCKSAKDRSLCELTDTTEVMLTAEHVEVSKFS